MVTDIDDEAGVDTGDDTNINGVFSIIGKHNSATSDLQPDDLTDLLEKQQISST